MILQISTADRLRLEAVIADPNSPQKHAWRTWVVLMAANGRSLQEIIWRTGETTASVSCWRRCFVEAADVDGIPGDKPWPAPMPLAAQVGPTRTDLPGATEHWADLATVETAGASLGIVQQIWSSHGFQPDGARQLLADSRASASVRDIVDLYLHPPADAVVLSVDEKSQIPVTGRAWQRTSPEDDLYDPAACDLGQHATTNVFCALDIHSGRVIGRCMQRQRSQEFLRFLNAVEREIPAGKTAHVILDNYGPHKHSMVLRWLSRHPRFVFHFTPVGMSWINLVEIFFARLTRECLRQRAFGCVIDLQIAINGYVAETNANPRPLVRAIDPGDPLNGRLRRILPRADAHTSQEAPSGCIGRTAWLLLVSERCKAGTMRSS